MYSVLQGNQHGYTACDITSGCSLHAFITVLVVYSIYTVCIIVEMDVKHMYNLWYGFWLLAVYRCNLLLLTAVLLAEQVFCNGLYWLHQAWDYNEFSAVSRVVDSWQTDTISCTEIVINTSPFIKTCYYNAASQHATCIVHNLAVMFIDHMFWK